MGRAGWKNLEKMAAKALGGVRILRGGDYSQSLPDVLVDDKICVECKYRTNPPQKYFKLLDTIKPSDSLLVIHHLDRIIVSLSTFASIYKQEQPILQEFFFDNKTYSKFLEDALKQAEGYAGKRIPIVVFKRRSQIGALVYLKKENWIKVILGKYNEEETSQTST